MPSKTFKKWHSDYECDPPLYGLTPKCHQGKQQFRNQINQKEFDSLTSKYTWAIHKPKWYNKVLKYTIPIRKSSFVYIFLGNRDMEIPIPKIQI